MKYAYNNDVVGLLLGNWFPGHAQCRPGDGQERKSVLRNAESAGSRLLGKCSILVVSAGGVQFNLPRES